MPKLTSFCKLFLLGLFTSCAASKDVVVPLTDTLQFSREMDASAFTTRRITADSSMAAYANQIGLDTYIVTQFLHRPWEQRYREWKKGDVDSAAFASVLRRYTNETNFTDSLPALDNESLFLFGRKSSGEYVLVADENNNNSFQDDLVRPIVPAIGKPGSNLAAERARVHVTNIKGYEKEKVLSFSTTFELQPSVASAASRPASNDFYLNLVASESFIGGFRYRGKVHKVALRNTSYPVFNDKPAFAKLKFAAGNEDSAFLKRWNTRPEYRVGDTVAIGKQVFLIKDASSLSARVTLKPLRISPKKVSPKQITPRLEATASNREK